MAGLRCLVRRGAGVACGSVRRFYPDGRKNCRKADFIARFHARSGNRDFAPERPFDRPPAARQCHPFRPAGTLCPREPDRRRLVAALAACRHLPCRPGLGRIDRCRAQTARPGADIDQELRQFLAADRNRRRQVQLSRYQPRPIASRPSVRPQRGRQPDGCPGRYAAIAHRPSAQCAGCGGQCRHRLPSE